MHTCILCIDTLLTIYNLILQFIQPMLSDVINVVFNAGDNRVTVSINITDDNDDEGGEAFGLVHKRTDDAPDTVQIIGPTTAFGITEDNDEPDNYVAIHVYTDIVQLL